MLEDHTIHRPSATHRSRVKKLVANDACKIHRQTHAQMPRDGADTLAIDGPAHAVGDADQETSALFDLLLVPTLRGTARYMRHTARKFPEHADEASGSTFSPEARERIKRRLAENAR
jgi:hypothetical protein